MKAMEHIKFSFYELFGGAVGVYYSLMNINTGTVVGEALSIINAVILGGGGALGAWLVKKYLIDGFFDKKK